MFRQLQSRILLVQRHISLTKYHKHGRMLRFISSTSSCPIALSPQRINESNTKYRDFFNSDNTKIEDSGTIIEDDFEDNLAERAIRDPEFEPYTSDQVWLNNVPYTATEEEIAETCKDYGVSEVKIVKGRDDVPRGQAIVTFHTMEAGSDAMKEQEFFCKGRRLRVGAQRPTQEAFRQMFPPSATLHFSGFTEEYSSPQVISSKLLPSNLKRYVTFVSYGLKQAYGFMIFSSIDKAAEAKELFDKFFEESPTRQFKCNFAKSARTKTVHIGADAGQWMSDTGPEESNVVRLVADNERNEFIRQKPQLSKALFVGQMPRGTTAIDLRNVFSRFDLFGVWIALDREGGSRNHGFIKCKSLEAAAEILMVASKTGGFVVEDQKLDVKFSKFENVCQWRFPTTNLLVSNFNEKIRNGDAVVEDILMPTDSFEAGTIKSCKSDRDNTETYYINFSSISKAAKAFEVILAYNRRNRWDAIHVQYQ